MGKISKDVLKEAHGIAEDAITDAIEQGGVSEAKALDALASVGDALLPFAAIGNAAEKLLGLPDDALDAIFDKLEASDGAVIRDALQAIVDATRPDPEKIRARAAKAQAKGKTKKAKRLLARAKRVEARQA